jgi:hypothetical protein
LPTISGDVAAMRTPAHGLDQYGAMLKTIVAIKKLTLTMRKFLAIRISTLDTIVVGLINLVIGCNF